MNLYNDNKGTNVKCIFQLVTEVLLDLKSSCMDAFEITT